MNKPDSPRGTRWAAQRPYASLLVCLALMGLQVMAWPLLFLLGTGLDEGVTAALTVLMVIWFFLPLGAVYGIYLGVTQRRLHGSGMLPTLGVAANTVYLLLALLIWVVTFSGTLTV